MTRKLLIGVAAAALAVLAASWAVAPVFAGQALIRAAKAGDARKLERLVDFTALRASLKEELNQELIARMRSDPRVAGSGLGDLGLMLAPMILSGAVDTVVTPEVLARMVTTAEVPDPTRKAPADPGDRSDDSDIHQSWGYRDLNHFAVTLTDRDHPDQHLALILERRGVFAWKLSAVDLQSERS
jgi:hypothetical protein